MLDIVGIIIIIIIISIIFIIIIIIQQDKISTYKIERNANVLLLYSPTTTRPVGLKTEIKLNVLWSGSHGFQKLLSFGNVLRNARVLPLWTVMEMR